jgi:hypothetical protein
MMIVIVTVTVTAWPSDVEAAQNIYMASYFSHRFGYSTPSSTFHRLQFCWSPCLATDYLAIIIN